MSVYIKKKFELLIVKERFDFTSQKLIIGLINKPDIVIMLLGVGGIWDNLIFNQTI